jgi:hypothetical protein
MFPTWSDWDFKYTPQGLAKRRRRRALLLASYALTILGLYRARKAGVAMRDLPKMLEGYVRGYLRMAMLMGAGVLQRVAGAV